jgi:hypothetical protein
MEDLVALQLAHQPFAVTQNFHVVLHSNSNSSCHLSCLDLDNVRKLDGYSAWRRNSSVRPAILQEPDNAKFPRYESIKTVDKPTATQTGQLGGQ